MSCPIYKLYWCLDNMYEEYTMLLLFPWTRPLISHLKWYFSGLITVEYLRGVNLCEITRVVEMDWFWNIVNLCGSSLMAFRIDRDLYSLGPQSVDNNNFGYCSVKFYFLGVKVNGNSGNFINWSYVL